MERMRASWKIGFGFAFALSGCAGNHQCLQSKPCLVSKPSICGASKLKTCLLKKLKGCKKCSAPAAGSAPHCHCGDGSATVFASPQMLGPGPGSGPIASFPYPGAGPVYVPATRSVQSSPDSAPPPPSGPISTADPLGVRAPESLPATATGASEPKANETAPAEDGPVLPAPKPAESEKSAMNQLPVDLREISAEKNRTDPAVGPTSFDPEQDVAPAVPPVEPGAPRFLSVPTEHDDVSDPRLAGRPRMIRPVAAARPRLGGRSGSAEDATFPASYDNGASGANPRGPEFREGAALVKPKRVSILSRIVRRMKGSGASAGAGTPSARGETDDVAQGRQVLQRVPLGRLDEPSQR